MAYSTSTDLLLGDMVISSTVSKSAFVEDAAAEIDSIIGQRYETPIDITADPPTVENHSIALLKRLNNHLATGRLVMAMAIGGEDNSNHAYGLFMVRSALREIWQIANGEIDLVGAVEYPEAGNDNTTGPSIANEDAVPAVAAFYDYTMNPPGAGIFPSQWHPGSAG